ncbi:MAG TPA: sulfite exporter TauE/SafE family protein [Xanthobacteraceae bacterium]|nr:sulfite exporter TauE/SafE family protein [Xanthobacteraceae bacterium]
MPDWTMIAIVLPTLVLAYIIFGIAGFGTALVAAPILAHAMPIASVVPLLALLDFGAAALNGFKLSDKIATAELAWLAPLMIAGSVVGVTLLISLPGTLLMFLLGVFAAGYGLYSLLAPPSERKFAKPWVGVFGPVGGIFSAMFGSGGFLYAIYLSRRLDDKDAIRATQSTLIGMSTLTRVLLFLGVGIYSDFGLLLLAIAAIPAMGAGIYAGQWFAARLSRQQFLRFVYVLLIATGSTLIVRAVGT